MRIIDNNNPTLRHIEKCEHRKLFKNINDISKLQASCKSRILECDYYLKVATEYDTFLSCSGKPNIDIPIIIYIPNLNFSIEEHKPEEWGPEVMPVCNIDLPSAEELGIDVGLRD